MRSDCSGCTPPVSRLLARPRAAQLDQAPKPEPPAKSKRPAAKKTRSKKISSRKKAATKPVETVLDAVGLARPVGFKDFPGAVSVMCEAKTLPKGERLDWQPTSPRQFMAIWEAEELINKFRDKHADAVIEQRYKLASKSLIELVASYADQRADHRVVCQARDR